ncbi:putative nucleoredoxin [Ochromonadaceae sp. CCMP2298]|nr:putative nucleoredoxin [Ochromonadaceae sp. CCMP2298]|mmetsp:Transcript_3002/g.6396  ORF Transcript_3002/g.6396 Transcript_3002/m.6396 type:complete len:149 (+) Transcript_3002:125-571(+)
MSWKSEFFGPELLTKEGVQPTEQALAGKTRIGIYFSAHWCPPCRGFTPVLSEFFEQLEEEDASALQIIFVSSDNDDASFTSYYGSMPWMAVPFAATDKIQALNTKFEVRGIPSFVVLDAADGSVKDADARTTVAAAKGVTSKATARWD